MRIESNYNVTEYQNIHNKGFILPFWEKIFRLLGKISIFNVIKNIKRIRVDEIFIEKWVFWNLLLSVISSIIVYEVSIDLISMILSVYGMARIMEVIVYQINVLLFDPYRARIRGKKYSIKSPTRMVLLLLHNYVELIFWFSTIYIYLSTTAGINLGFNWSDYIRISALCFTSNELSFIDYPGITRIIVNVAYAEMVGGLVMTIISLARFIGLLPSVDTDDCI